MDKNSTNFMGVFKTKWYMLSGTFLTKFDTEWILNIWLPLSSFSLRSFHVTHLIDLYKALLLLLFGKGN